MRKKKKKSSSGKAETKFLKQRRMAVAAAVSKSADSKSEMPSWMQSLSERLWTNKHKKEVDFNKGKMKVKRLEAFRRGGYVPASSREKRALDQQLVIENDKESKRRKEWEKNVSERCLAA